MTQMVTDGASDTPGQPATGQAGLKTSSQPKSGRTKKKHGDSSAAYLWHRLVALDFMNQAMLLAGTLLLCVFPLLIVLSALSGPGAARSFSQRLGLNQQAAADLGHLFASAGTTSATINAACLVLLVLFMVGGANAVQQVYERIFELDSRGVRDLLRRLIWAGLVVGWLFLGGLVIAGLFTFLPGRMMHDVVFAP